MCVQSKTHCICGLFRNHFHANAGRPYAEATRFLDPEQSECVQLFASYVRHSPHTLKCYTIPFITFFLRTRHLQTYTHSRRFLQAISVHPRKRQCASATLHVGLGIIVVFILFLKPLFQLYTCSSILPEATIGDSRPNVCTNNKTFNDIPSKRFSTLLRCIVFGLIFSTLYTFGRRRLLVSEQLDYV